MAVLDIVKVGHPVLKQTAEEVPFVSKKIRRLLDDMAETMYKADGVGLAAPQVNESKRLVVIDIGQGLIELVNPVIVSGEGEQVGPEGCLSIPDVFGDVKRFNKVEVQALNRNNKKIKIVGEGLLARALQHEIDHLNGILFIEKIEDTAESTVKESIVTDKAE
ncbi:MAG: peptide deformylase [Veillonellaceae bacterium]|nr:peptide deformylase [Veillonellaceae bacterium]